jgi:hypothetical protein
MDHVAVKIDAIGRTGKASNKVLLGEVVRQCLSAVPQDRPTASGVTQVLKTIFKAALVIDTVKRCVVQHLS